MSSSNGFGGVQLNFEFESFDKVNKEYLKYIQRLSQSSQVKIGMDSSSLDSLKDTFNQLTKTNIKVFDSGAYNQIQTFKNSLGEVLKITESFNNQNGKTSTSYSLNGTKELENQKALYKELNELQQTEFKLKQQLVTADNNVYTELNKQLEVTRQMQSAVGRSINSSGLTDEKQNNDLLKQRIELTNNLKLAQAKNNDNQASQLEKDVTSMQNIISKLGNSGLVNDSVITQLQTKLNSINTNTPKEEIKALEDVIKNLGSSTSSISSVQNQITKMETELQGLKGKFGESFIDKNATTQLQAYETELNNLKNTLSQMKSGQTIFTGSEISTQLSSATNASREFKSALSSTASEAQSIGSRIQQSLGNVGIYVSTAVAVRQLFDAFKDGLSYVKYLDDSFTDMAMTMNISKTQFKDMSDQIDEMANQLGVTSQYVHDIAKLLASLLRNKQ